MVSSISVLRVHQTGVRIVTPTLRNVTACDPMWVASYRPSTMKWPPMTTIRGVTAFEAYLGTFGTRAAAEKHERAIQFFKRHG